ncbi:hypothetical protein ACJJTC_014918 [Scirpophaga incertulas]
MWPLVVLILLVMLLIKKVNGGPASFPPGPRAFPFVGNIIAVLLELRRVKYHHRVWESWSKQYGPILGLRLCSINAVVVFGKDLIKAISSSDVFDGRPDGFVYTLRSFGKKLGIVFNDGRSWVKTRKVVLKFLKSFGYGTRVMEQQIAEECIDLVKMISRANEPILANNIFDVSVINIVWRLVAGKRYELNDERLLNLCGLITRCFKAVDMSGGVMTFMPILRHFIPSLIGYTEMTAVHRALHQFLAETIEDHRKTIDLENPRDVIDAFLIEMKREENTFTEEDLRVVCLDMLEAGVETASNTAVFMILYLVREQQIQRKLQMEIDDVVGRHRSPSLSDRSRMVYTEAVLLETLRISSIAPVGIPHMALADTTIGNYAHSKGNIRTIWITRSPQRQLLEGPRPIHTGTILTKEGNLIQHECFIPFGCGKRRCLGEGLAHAELFMFITYILQKFDLKVPEGEPLPSTEPVDGITLSAKPFKILCLPRN